MNNRFWLISLGLLIVLIFGGGFLIRLIQDGDFYIAEFIGGVIGAVILMIGISLKKKDGRSKADFGK